MSTLDDIDLPLPGRTEGKVRVSYDWSPTERLFVTTDRLSAFDRIITSVPCKGQVLNQLSAWWFERTAHIVPNHLLEVPDPNVTIAHAAVPLPVHTGAGESSHLLPLSSSANGDSHSHDGQPTHTSACATVLSTA